MLLTKFSIHPLFFFVMLIAFLYGFIYEISLLFAIVLIHESGHAAMAYSFGWRIKRIQLLPFGGVAEVEEHGNKPYQEEALVVLAGPLMNAIMIGVSWLLLKLNVWELAFVIQFIEYNLIILVFNLLPIWPLDGGKLVQLALSLMFPYKRAIRYSLISSTFFLVLYLGVVSAFFYTYFYLWSVAVFLIVSLYLEARQSPYQYMRFLMSRYELDNDKLSLKHRPKKGKLRKPLYNIHTRVISPEETVKQILDGLYRQKVHYFCVLNRNGSLLYMFEEGELLHYYFERKWIHRAVGDIIG